MQRASTVRTGRPSQDPDRRPEVAGRLRRIDTFMLDKTGTLTAGRMPALRTAAIFYEPGALGVDAVVRPTGVVE